MIAYLSCAKMFANYYTYINSTHSWKWSRPQLFQTLLRNSQITYIWLPSTLNFVIHTHLFPSFVLVRNSRTNNTTMRHTNYRSHRRLLVLNLKYQNWIRIVIRKRPCCWSVRVWNEWYGVVLEAFCFRRGVSGRGITR